MRPTRSLRPLVTLAGAALIAGCSLAPGAHMDYSGEVAPIDDLVDIQPITPGLISTFRQVEPRARSMSPDLRTQLSDWEYIVGPGDVLSVIVYDHPELTIPAGAERSAEDAGNEVRSDGTIFYPYIGQVQVGGRTLAEIRSILARRLSNFLTDPQVDVRIAAFRSQKVYVSGSVENPGTQPITSIPLTVADAISQAGGATDGANWHSVILTRDGREERISLFSLLREGDQTQNRMLIDGDVLHIPDSSNQGVAVMGQVQVPGNVGLGNERISLTEAISRAGGINEESAAPSGIFVIRGTQPGSEKLATVYQLDVRNAAAFAMGNHFTLEPQDVIYVTTAPIARWNRVISLLLPSVGLPGTVADSATDVRDL
ncbi:polysaccharide export protein [Halomonas sp. RA08-2]|uniref:polysaccharide export protein n=1 Tax=Halomonas sp. RA08-2 TaxID=3440842 RepID=UPI003EEF54A0